MCVCVYIYIYPMHYKMQKAIHDDDVYQTILVLYTKRGRLDTEMLPPRKPMAFQNSRTSNQQTRLSTKTKITRQQHYRYEEGKIHEIHCSLICEM